MEGNRHLYPLLLHINVTFFTLLMASIGIMGYLFYGADVQQMIIWSLPLQDPLTIAVNVTLIIAIVFTYPLQVFPIVEIMEQLIFAPGEFWESGLIITQFKSVSWFYTYFPDFSLIFSSLLPNLSAPQIKVPVCIYVAVMYMYNLDS